MAFRTVDEFLALTGDERPSRAEMWLIEAVRAGIMCRISDTLPEAATRENTARAGLLRLLSPFRFASRRSDKGCIERDAP